MYLYFHTQVSAWCALLVTLTGVLEGDVVAVVGVLQLVAHHPEGHDLLADHRVRPGDVHAHLGVVHLVGQTVLLHLGEVPDTPPQNTQTTTTTFYDYIYLHLVRLHYKLYRCIIIIIIIIII